MKDDEVYNSTGTSYTSEFWQYDTRTARRWNIDPIVKYDQSGYSAFANNPIWFIDPLGNDTASYDMNSEEWHNFDPDNDVVSLPDIEISAEEPNQPQTVDYSNYSIKGLEYKINGLSSNPIYRYMQLNDIHSFGSGIKWGNGLTPEQQARHDQWMSGIYALTYGLHISIGATVALPMAIETAPAISGKTFAIQTVWAASDAGVQYAFTGDVDVVSVGMNYMPFGIGNLTKITKAKVIFEGLKISTDAALDFRFKDGYLKINDAKTFGWNVGFGSVNSFGGGLLKNSGGWYGIPYLNTITTGSNNAINKD